MTLSYQYFNIQFNIVFRYFCYFNKKNNRVALLRLKILKLIYKTYVYYKKWNMM